MAEQPLFFLSDICRVLDLRTSDVKERLKTPGVDSIGVGVQTGVKKDVLSKHPLPTNDVNQTFTFVNEDGRLNTKKPVQHMKLWTG